MPPQRLFDETLTLSNEVEKIDCSHIGFLGFVLTDVTVYLAAVSLFNAAPLTRSGRSPAP